MLSVSPGDFSSMSIDRFDINSQLRYPVSFDFPFSRTYARRAFYKLMDGSVIFFCHGVKDLWAAAIARMSDLRCWEVTKQDFKCVLACDSSYFELLLYAITVFHVSPSDIERDVRWIYDCSWLEANLNVCRSITNHVVQSYRHLGAEKILEVAYLQLYYGFIAECYWKRFDFDGNVISRSVLGAAIKLNGVLELLWNLHRMYEIDIVNMAANDSRVPGVAIRQCAEKCLEQPMAIDRVLVDFKVRSGYVNLDNMERWAASQSEHDNSLKQAVFYGNLSPCFAASDFM